MKSVIDVLDFAMTMEQEGKFFFTEWTARVKNPATKEIFQELAKWEEEHWQYISSQRNSLASTGKVAPVSSTLGAAEQKALETFYNRGRGEGSTTEVTPSMGDLSALRLAITIEQDLHEFYRNAAAIAPDEDLKDMFTMLYKWEITHREILEQEYDSLKRLFWNEMGFQPF